MTAPPEMDAMRVVLRETVKILFPFSVKPDDIIIPHVWRDRTYLREDADGVSVWRGWSVNLSKTDPRYRTLYIDIGDNAGSLSDNVALFGSEFARAIRDMGQFIVIFVSACPAWASKALKIEGFVPRVINPNVVHGCAIAHPEDFLAHHELIWAAKAAKLMNLQRDLSTVERRQNE